MGKYFDWRANFPIIIWYFWNRLILIENEERNSGKKQQ
jgi:hypothetical protein